MPKTYLVTGGSKGIGAEFIRQILRDEPDSQIIGAARTPDKSNELNELKEKYGDRLKTVKLDVIDLEGIETAAREVDAILGDAGLDVLISNAGQNAGNFNDALDPDIVATLQQNLAANTVGPVALVQAFLPLLRKGKSRTIWATSSDAGSITGGLAQKGAAATYAISKVALNMAMVKLGRSLDEEKFTILLLHPGFVATNFGGDDVKDQAEITPEESVSGSLKALRAKGPQDSGTFWNWKGEAMPW